MRKFQSLAKIENSNSIKMKNDKMIIMKQLEIIKKLKEEKKKNMRSKLKKFNFKV